MIDDRELWACANLLIEQHGDQAWLVAAQRADALLEQGENEGHYTFLGILERIKELEQTKPDGTVH